MMDYLALDALPSPVEFLLTGGLPLLLSVGIFYLGLRLEEDGKPGWIKWLGVIPAIVGLILTFPYVQALGDPGYQGGPLFGKGRKEVFMHWGAFIAPALGLLIIAVWGFVDARSRRLADMY